MRISEGKCKFKDLFLYSKVCLLGFYLLQKLIFLCVREGRGTRFSRLSRISRCSGVFRNTRFLIAHGHIVRNTLYLQFGRSGRMNTRELHLSLYFYFAGLFGAAYQYGSRTPFNSPWIGIDPSDGHDLSHQLLHRLRRRNQNHQPRVFCPFHRHKDVVWYFCVKASFQFCKQPCH